MTRATARLAIQQYYFGPASRMLDLYPSAMLAYSFRRLLTVVTRVVRLRDTTNNAEKDFGCNYLGNFDSAAVTTWLGGHSAAVVTWYDQSGSGAHVTQATAANQPSLNLAAIGSLPGAVFDGTNDRLDGTGGTATDMSQPWSSAFVAKQDSSGSDGGFFISQPGNALVSGAGFDVNQVTIYAGNNAEVTAADGTTWAVAGLANSTSSKVRVNGSTTTGLNASTRQFRVNAWSVGTFGFGGFFKGTGHEAIVWGSDQSANFAGIETDQRTYWGV